MRNTTIRWAIYLFSLFVAGPIAGMLVASARAVDGGPGSPLVSASPIMGLAAAIGALTIALVIGVVTARLLGLAPAMTASGLVVAWASWRSAEVDQLIRTAHSGKPLGTLAIEGLVFGVVGLVVAIACWMMGRAADAGSQSDKAGQVAASAQASPDSIRERRALREGEGSILWLIKKTLSGTNSLTAIVVGVLAGGAAAWLIGATPLKGQAIFAAIAAGTFAAAACRLVDFEAPVPTMFVPLVVLAILGPLTGLVMASSSGIVAATYKGTLFPLANISPLDWIAGGLLGIPMGVSWAGSMIEKRIQEA